MDQEVEEVSFLPGEAILNKKAVYEPTKGQRFRQIVCSRGWAICILLVMGVVMVTVAAFAAFARPASLVASQLHCPEVPPKGSTASPGDADEKEPQTYVATNGEPFPWRNLTLPRSVIPEAYKIFLHANLSESVFFGKVQMTLKVIHDTDFIILHASKLNVTNVKVLEPQDGDSGEDMNFDKELEVLKELEYPRNEMYYVKVATLLRTGIILQVHADFQGSLASLSKMNGFYKSSYTVNGQERFMASTQFQATYARQAFPCMDEPALKAKFTISMLRDPHHITLFNTPLVKSTPYNNGLFLDEYEESVKMSTYLVAYVICDFKSISRVTNSGIKVRVFAPEDKIYMGYYALDAAVNILDNYDTFFGVPYPLPKQDLIAIPNFAAGAMENWGLITYRDTSILYDPNVSTENDKQWVATVVSHELAHQWFGNLVTLEWWNDLWLNEGFASFVENIGVDGLDKELHQMDNFMFSLMDALYLDSLASSHPISVPVDDPADIEAVFDTISYHKGAALIRMLKGVMGDQQFKQGLTRYLKKHEFGNAKNEDLWSSLQEVSTLPSDLTVAQVMDTWTKQMGYPVVTVTRKDGRLLLSQERFLIWDMATHEGSKKATTDSPYNYKWNVPFTFMTSADPKQSTLVWMKRGSAQIEIPDGSVLWVKGNVDAMGFYRVNYDPAGWQGIFRQLSVDCEVFSVADRMSLFDDAFSLARAGLLDYTIPLDMSRYLVNETSYFVWSTVLMHLEFLDERLLLEEEYDWLRAYILSLAKQLIDVQGWHKKNKYLESNMQSQMLNLGYKLEYQAVLDKAVDIFRHWKQDETVNITNGLRSIVYRAGVKYGNKTDWDTVFQRYMTNIIPSDHIKLLSALGSSRESRVLQILLQYSLEESRVKSQDITKVVSSVANNNNGQLLSWKFFKEHWDDIFERAQGGPFILPTVVKSVITGFNTQFDYDEIVQFFKHKNLASAKLAYEQALEIVQSHIHWTNTSAAIVKTWLKNSVKTV